MGIDGIYSGYMTGAEGNGFSMFVFSAGAIVGADPLGVSFDGKYEKSESGHAVHIKVTVPSDGTVIQGVSSGPNGMTYDVEMVLEDGFEDHEFIRIDTPLGPVILRLEKLRSLDI